MKWIILLICSIWLMIGSLYFLWTDVYWVWKIRTDGVVADGKITQVEIIETKRNIKAVGARLTIEFTDDSGNPQSFRTKEKEYSRFNDKPGSKLPIRYLQGNPRKSMTITQAEESLSEPLGFALAFLAFSLWLGRHGIKTRRERDSET